MQASKSDVSETMRALAESQPFLADKMTRSAGLNPLASRIILLDKAAKRLILDKLDSELTYTTMDEKHAARGAAVR